HGALTLLRGDQGGVRAFDVDGRGTDLAFWIGPAGRLLPARRYTPPPGSVASDIRAGGPARVIDDLWEVDSRSAALPHQPRQRAAPAAGYALVHGGALGGGGAPPGLPARRPPPTALLRAGGAGPGPAARPAGRGGHRAGPPGVGPAGERAPLPGPGGAVPRPG